MDFRELFLKQKEATRKRTEAIFPLIPRDKAAWAPVQGALPLGLMLRHIWNSEAGQREIPLYNRWNYHERRIPEGLFAILGQVTDIDQEIEKMGKVHRETMELISKAPAEIFEQEFHNEKFNIHRKGYVVLLGIIEHEIHHRAQLMTYLRILGHPVPGI